MHLKHWQESHGVPQGNKMLFKVVERAFKLKWYNKLERAFSSVVLIDERL